LLIKTGIPSAEDIAKIEPSRCRLAKGPVAIVECFQRIPCNPCATSCPTGAIEPFENINDLPKLNTDKCTGCGVCVSSCPGLAVFIIDETYSEKEAVVKIPYEYRPFPEVKSVVEVTNRAGKVVGTGRVIQVVNTNKQDKTAVVSVTVPKELSMEVRSIKVHQKSPLESTCICRCEEVSLRELREAIAQGYTDMNELKRKLRLGMGPCQGLTCRQLILTELSLATGQPVEEINLTTFRPPTKPIKISVIAGDGNEK